MNLLMIGKTCMRMKDKDRAVDYLTKTRDYPVRTEDDKKVEPVFFKFTLFCIVIDISQKCYKIEISLQWKTNQKSCVLPLGRTRDFELSSIYLADIVLHGNNLEHILE